jgi:hypothetical protein
MKTFRLLPIVLALMGAVGIATPAFATATAEEAAALKSRLTPLGAERGANKDSSIPAWDGGLTKTPSGWKPGDRRPDPFAADKPLYSVTAKNMAEHAERLSDGQKAMLQKYPSYRIDVYPTRRTAGAPQWVYDNTAKNATRAKLVDGSNYPIPSGAYGGIPFPIPKAGLEVMWNHLLRFQSVANRNKGGQTFMVTPDGKRVLTTEGLQEVMMPFYDPKGSAETWDGTYYMTRVLNSGPPIRAGEALVARVNVDDAKTNAWVYLTGQRRVRKLPNPGGDTPLPQAAGVMSFDEVAVFAAGPGNFDWKLVGKKELLIPYNNYKSMGPTNAEELIHDRHLNPDFVRWELHRVWVVDAELKPGKRHSAVKGRYYFDEDSWMAVLADRWDAKGQLWKTLFGLSATYPEVPVADLTTYGFYDLLSGAWYAGPYNNKPSERFGTLAAPDLKDSSFTPDALVGDQLR